MKRLTLFLILSFGVPCAWAQEGIDSTKLAQISEAKTLVKTAVQAVAEGVVEGLAGVFDEPDAVEASPEQLWDRANTAYVNGEQADIVEVDEGLMAVLCPAGTNRVDFVYQADGYSLSRTVTLAAIPVFAVYCGFWWDRKKRKTA